MSFKMQFPSSEETERDTSRKVLMHLGHANEIATLSVERDQQPWGPDPGPADRALNEHILEFEGRQVRRMSLEDALEFIPLVQERLDLSHQLQETYAATISEQEGIINEHNEKVSKLEAGLAQLVAEDAEWAQARGGQMMPSGYICNMMMTVGPDVWLSSRNMVLRDTHTWKTLDLLKSRAASPRSPVTLARQRLTATQRALAEERKVPDRCLGRLYDLRATVEWWRRELSASGEPQEA
jgi:hypothetical protein